MSNIKQARIELTERCNRYCTFCYNESSPKKGSELELTLQELKDLISQLKEMGVQYVSFTGGEPLIRKSELIELTSYATSLEMKVNLATNGDLLDDHILGELKQAGLEAVQLTINSSPAHTEIHENGYGKGHYSSVVSAMRRVVSHGINRLIIRYTLMRNNIHEMVPTFQFVTEETANYGGTTLFKIRDCVESGRARGKGLSLRNDQEQSIYDAYLQLFNEKSHVIIYLTEPFSQLSRGPNSFENITETTLAPNGRMGTAPGGTRVILDHCACSKDGGIITINYKGDVIPCIFRPDLPIGNIKKNPPQQLWETAILSSTQYRSSYGQLCNRT